jgi:hypothetical protein
MKRFALVVLAMWGIAFSGEFSNTLYGGLALAVGEGSGAMRPGPNVCVDPSYTIATNVAIGAHAEYTWLSATSNPHNSDFRAGVHIIDIGFVPKLLLPINPEATLFVEEDPGLFLTWAYYATDKLYTDWQYKSFFGLTTGAGILLTKVRFAFKFKSVFSTTSKDRIRSANWILFNVGIPVG